MTAFGDSDFAFRLPSIVFFAVFLVCIYTFVARHSSGLIAAMVPFSTVAYTVSYEGRMYALLLACCGLAILFWQVVEQRRRLALWGLGFSLTAAVYSHYYGLILAAVIALAELVRCLVRKKVDPQVWFVLLVAPALALISLQPLIMAARRFAGSFWTDVGLLDAAYLYPSVFHLTTIPVIVLVLVVTVLSIRRPPASVAHPPFHEVAVGVAFMLWPVFVYLLAVLVTNALWYRYVIPTVVGAAIAGPAALRRVFRTSSSPHLAFLASLFLITVGTCAGYFAQQRREVVRLDELLGEVAARSNGSVPLAIADAEQFLQLQRYLDAEGRSRVVYLSDTVAPPLAGVNPTVELALEKLQVWAPLNITPYRKFLAVHSEFTVLLPEARSSSGTWLIRQLWQDGAKCEVVGFHQGQPVLRVRM